MRKRDKEYYLSLKERIKEMEEDINPNDEQLISFIKHLKRKIVYWERKSKKQEGK